MKVYATRSAHTSVDKLTELVGSDYWVLAKVGGSVEYVHPIALFVKYDCVTMLTIHWIGRRYLFPSPSRGLGFMDEHDRSIEHILHDEADLPITEFKVLQPFEVLSTSEVVAQYESVYGKHQ